jgi:uncharacterized protein (DUF2141 family)
MILTVLISGITGQEPREYGDLTAIISGFNNDDGMMKITLNNSHEDYKSHDRDYRREQGPVKNNLANVTFGHIPFGEYAIKVYHDANNDNELNTNFLGMPTEEYGFSNNARGSFGPASWDDAKFLFNSAKDTLHITIK